MWGTHDGGIKFLYAKASATNASVTVPFWSKLPKAGQSRHRHTEVAVLPHTSQRVHISHPLFWKDANGAPPAPFTPISHADVVGGKWVAADEVLKEYAEKYTQQLEASSGKFQHIIWPEHCLIGSPGHCVVPPVLDGTYVRGCGQGYENSYLFATRLAPRAKYTLSALVAFRISHFSLHFLRYMTLIASITH